MTDKIQKILEEIVRLKSNLIHGACASQIAMETRCKEEAYDEVISLLDSMKEEPVSDDLEEAIGQSFIYHENRGDDFRSDSQIETAYRSGFETGAKWHKEKMMAKAIDAHCFGF